MQFRILGAFRYFRVEVDKITIEIDIIFVDAPVVRKAVRVIGVNQYKRGIHCKSRLPVFGKKAGLAARAAKTFNAVGRGASNDNMPRILSTKPHDICAKRLVVGPC